MCSRRALSRAGGARVCIARDRSAVHVWARREDAVGRVMTDKKRGQAVREPRRDARCRAGGCQKWVLGRAPVKRREGRGALRGRGLAEAAADARIGDSDGESSVLRLLSCSPPSLKLPRHPQPAAHSLLFSYHHPPSTHIAFQLLSVMFSVKKFAVLAAVAGSQLASAQS